MSERWAIQQETGGEWVTLQTRESEEAARDGAQALRSMMESGRLADHPVRIVPVHEEER